MPMFSQASGQTKLMLGLIVKVRQLCLPFPRVRVGSRVLKSGTRLSIATAATQRLCAV